MPARSSPRPTRATGAGTVYQIKRGRSAGYWRRAVALPNGRRPPIYGKTREDVEAKLLDACHALAHNKPVSSAQRTAVTVGAPVGTSHTPRPSSGI
jgi:hypothetical protein